MIAYEGGVKSGVIMSEYSKYVFASGYDREALCKSGGCYVIVS